MDILKAILLGLLFGVALQRVGATNPQNIINMMRLTDLHLMKAILLAIGVASIGLFVGMSIGWIDPGHLSIKSSYVGVIVGGAILGAGFALSGFCPGTGVGAMAEGRRDALWFVLGGLLGALAYTIIYGRLAETFLFNEIGGGKVTLAQTNTCQALIDNVPGVVVGSVLGVIFIGIAAVLPQNLKLGQNTGGES